MPLIEALIDKDDTSELVRDKVAEILLAESASQMALAVTAAKDPALWKLRVFLERTSPWEEWRDAGDSPDLSPIVSVSIDTLNYDAGKSDVIKRQHCSASINIDCYGVGVSTETDDGHDPGDLKAALESQRAVKLVRNILMSANYTYLDMRGLVGKRWLQNVQWMQVDIDAQAVGHVRVGRFILNVDFNEFSPQFAGVPLAAVSAGVRRRSTGELYFTAEFGA